MNDSKFTLPNTYIARFSKLIKFPSVTDNAILKFTVAISVPSEPIAEVPVLRSNNSNFYFTIRRSPPMTSRRVNFLPAVIEPIPSRSKGP